MPGDGLIDRKRGRFVRVFRIAIPASQIDRSRVFYESAALDADDTVPSRLCFHCGEVIRALIDWEVEARGPFQPTPDNLSSRRKNSTRYMSALWPLERVRSRQSRNVRSLSCAKLIRLCDLDCELRVGS